MDPAILAAIKCNLIPSSHDAVSDWTEFPWHLSGGKIDTMRSNSSQALAIDVFGTLKTTSPEHKDRIIGSLANELGLPGDGPWQVELEWIDTQNLLRETGTRSQIDVTLVSPKASICVEAKFTEPDGGCCSQPNPIVKGPNKGKRQCNGHFELQTNPVNGKVDKCALRAKGIRYWAVAPQVMHIDEGIDHRPCPFAGSTYQWMRNLCTAHEAARTQDKKAGVLIVFADAKHLPMAQKVNSPQWAELTRFIRQEKIGFKPLSYQQVISHAIDIVKDDAGELSRWTALSNWVTGKIESTARPSK